MARSRSAVSVGRPEAPSQQQNSNMFTSQPRRLLQVEAGLGDALAGIEFQREIPERMGQKIRHLRCFPSARAKGYTAQGKVARA